MTISREQEKRLREFAPSYLQKDSHQSQRVRWGLETLFELLERTDIAAKALSAGGPYRPAVVEDSTRSVETGR